MIAARTTPSARSEPTLLAYIIGELVLSRFVPAAIIGFIVAAKLTGLIRRLQASGPPDAPFLALPAYLLQQGLTILFLAIIVVLFVVRRPVIGKHSPVVGGLVALAGSFALSVPVAGEVLEENTSALFASTVFISVGVGFSVLSLIALGRCFGVMPEARGLVTSGPYSLVRHPLYVGETISALGLVMATASFPYVGVFFVYCGLQYWRALNEEKALQEVFPEYEEYCRHTARFLPSFHRLLRPAPALHSSHSKMSEGPARSIH
ncbi:MAG: isoprenylcysteine carboxylmethyltransferase family protein [Chloroflexi bacterium]|nr:isoprenylcysteine carboxylmethyltransferase family protein [Chloroflexota bacterium]